MPITGSDRGMLALCLALQGAFEGTEPTTDRMGHMFSSLQNEANFWYGYVCKQLPPDHWLQPDSTGGNLD